MSIDLKVPHFLYFSEIERIEYETELKCKKKKDKLPQLNLICLGYGSVLPKQYALWILCEVYAIGVANAFETLSKYSVRFLTHSVPV